jgi:hypothetical protein
MATLSHPPLHQHEQHRTDLMELLLVILGVVLAVIMVVGVSGGF